MGKTAPTHVVEIFIAGSYDDAVRCCRAYCERGLCVTVERLDFVYTGGMESGVKVGLTNYPRFPVACAPDLLHIARGLAEQLRFCLYQRSYMIRTPETTYWESTDEDGMARKARGEHQ